ncbi:hypothetical protein [Pseudoalteromonas sp. CO325X]|nr:hypothetical protein [Pseudoalteromonas sp. CO325X]
MAKPKLQHNPHHGGVTYRLPDGKRVNKAEFDAFKASQNKQANTAKTEKE